METFSFDKHVLEVEYPPETSVKIKYGRGYQFASKPKGPDQVGYTLSFRAMFFFFTAPNVLDVAKLPSINMELLERFYNRHRLYEPFFYPHPTKGNLVVRFDEPLKYKLLENGQGQVEPFTIKLILQP